MVPIMPALFPASIESVPSDGPTVIFCSIFIGAGSAPAFRTIARSFASSMEKLPDICAFPPPILSWITGVEYTDVSSIIASLFLTLAAVTSSKSFAPAVLNDIET